MKIRAIDETASGVLVDPVAHNEYPFAPGETIEVPQDTGERAVASGLWKKESE